MLTISLSKKFEKTTKKRKNETIFNKHNGLYLTGILNIERISSTEKKIDKSVKSNAKHKSV